MVLTHVLRQASIARRPASAPLGRRPVETEAGQGDVRNKAQDVQILLMEVETTLGAVVDDWSSCSSKGIISMWWEIYMKDTCIYNIIYIIYIGYELL